MGTLGLDVDGVERLAGGHEEAVAFLASETEVGADVRKEDHSDAFAFRRKNVNAVVTVARPAGRGPDVAVDVAADAIGAPIAAYGERAVLIEQPHLSIVGDVAPDQVTPDAVPGAAFGPQGASPEFLDGCAADFIAGESLVEHDDI